ncbi:MAG: hypothetical protein CL858_21985 [Cupriavidus sp.]|jgi:hypothetical protein|nr:hypothetical protein [Cupriavidus sp.]
MEQMLKIGNVALWRSVTGAQDIGPGAHPRPVPTRCAAGVAANAVAWRAVSLWSGPTRYNAGHPIPQVFGELA